MADAPCSTCQVVFDAGAGTKGRSGQLLSPLWSWQDPAALTALRSRELGPILRACRRVNRLSQEKLAEMLGFDKTYISLIETGRRTIHDVATRRHISNVLAIPAHLLGVTDRDDTEFVVMLEFARSTIRLAELARLAGQATEAVKELWPVVARLEARARDGHLEAAALGVLVEAWISFGVCLGTVLPEERLPLALRWTAKGLAAARHVDNNGSSGLLGLALRMHGNELRKVGQGREAVALLTRAVALSESGRARGEGLALLARAAGVVRDHDLYEWRTGLGDDLMQESRQSSQSALAGLSNICTPAMIAVAEGEEAEPP